jgi:diguanylate cyclase
MQAVHAQGFDFSGISYGIAMVSESADRNVLKHLADTRMYEHKRQRKKRNLSS